MSITCFNEAFPSSPSGLPRFLWLELFFYVSRSPWKLGRGYLTTLSSVSVTGSRVSQIRWAFHLGIKAIMNSESRYELPSHSVPQHRFQECDAEMTCTRPFFSTLPRTCYFPQSWLDCFKSSFQSSESPFGSFKLTFDSVSSHWPFVYWAVKRRSLHGGTHVAL